METTRIEKAVQILELEGRAYVIGQDGTLQLVAPGQILLPGTLLVTDENTRIVYDDNPELPAEAAQVPMDNDTLAEVDAIQAAILAGLDPTELFEAPAAGPAAGPVAAGVAGLGSGNGGFVVVDRVGGFVQPEAGFLTAFNPLAFETVDTLDLLLPADEPLPPNSIPTIVIIPQPPTDPEGQPQLPGVDGAFSWVSEAGLEGGSKAGSGQHVTQGIIAINTGTDALAALEVLVQDKDGIWINVTNGGVVEGLYGTLVINPDFTWTYTLNGPVDHPNEGQVFDQDVLSDVFQIRVTDDDGDSASASLDIFILDDGPGVIIDGPTTVVEGESINGSWNMEEGADGATAQVLFGGQTYALGAPIDTGKGVLTVNANGTWVFVAAAGLDNSQAQALSFSIQVTDGDLDTDVVSQSISIADGAGPVGGGSISLLVDDQNLANGTTPAGPDSDSAVLNFTAGSDPIASLKFATDLSGLNASLSWERVSDTEIIGRDGGVDVVRLSLVASADNTQATVTATLLSNYGQHPGIDVDDVQQLGSIVVVATDLDGDQATGTVNLAVSDDVPSVSVAGPTAVVEGESINGSWNMEAGADGATAQVLFGGQTYALGAPIDTGKGVLTVNANGTWVFVAAAGLDNSQAQALSFSIQVTDGDLDTDVASQSISIADGAGPVGGGSISLLVDDQNLANGTTPAGPDSDSAVLNFTAGSDPIASLKFATDLSGLNASLSWERVSDTEIVGRDGGVDVVRLSLVASADNTQATVTATLLSNYGQHPGIDVDDVQQLGSIVVVATDLDGDQATGTVNLAVSDDVPSVSVAGPTTVVEGESINGSWNMEAGADGATAQVLFGGQTYALGAPIDTGKGVLTVNANGTWVFVAAAGLDNSQAQALSFSIQVTDGDLDTDVASQSISIADGAGPVGGGSISLLVDDQNLANGTTPAGPDSDSAVLNFTAGSDPIASLKFATDLSGLNASLSWERVSDTEIIGRDGGVDVVRLSLVASADNTQATVTATLLSNYGQHPGIDVDDVQQLGSIVVVATDLDGDQATGTVNLAVSDDVPTLSVMNLSIANIQATYQGFYQFNMGADVHGFASAFDASALVWQGMPDGYSFTLDAGFSNDERLFYKAEFFDGEQTQVFFTIAINSDGTYDFNLVTPEPIREVPVDSLLAGVSGGSNLASYTFNGDLFGGYFSLVATGLSENNKGELVDSTITISSSELGVGDNVMHGNKGDRLRLTLNLLDNEIAISVSELNFKIASSASAKPGDGITLFVVYKDGSSEEINGVIGVDYTISFEIDPGKVLDYADLYASDKNQFKIEGVALKYVIKEFPDDYQLDFLLTGADADQDTDDAEFSVMVSTTISNGYEISGSDGDDVIYGTDGNDFLIGDAGNDILIGGAGDDILIGGLGNNTLTGGDGADIFRFIEADAGSVNTITDFEKGIDQLDLSELLNGEESGNLNDYLNFSLDNGDTLLTVSPGGDGGNTQVIRFENQDLLADYGVNSSSALINAMLDDQSLMVDKS